MPTTALIFWLFLYLLRSLNRFPENRYFHQRWRKIQFSPCNISQDQPYWWNHGDVLWDFIHIFIYNLNSSHQLTQIRLIKYMTILIFKNCTSFYHLVQTLSLHILELFVLDHVTTRSGPTELGRLHHFYSFGQIPRLSPFQAHFWLWLSPACDL